MGVNETDPRPIPDDELDTLAVHALDALDPDEALAVEAALMADERARDVATSFRAAAGELAVAADGETEPRPRCAPGPRRRPHRPPRRGDRRGDGRRGPPGGGVAPAGHPRAADRRAVVRRRRPPEFAGWTVHDLVAHVATSEALFAQLLGLAEPSVPETVNANDERTAAAHARHRSLSPTIALAEYEAAAAAIDAAASAMTEADLEHEVEWWGVPMRVATVLVHRAFETWIHHDDVRRAIGLAESAPPAATIRTMSRRALGWLPLMLGAGGHDASGRVARVVLGGAGGGDYVVDLTDGSFLGDDADRDRARVDVELRADIVGFCQAIGNRVPAGGLAYEAEGDTALAADLVACLPLLAGL
ncbi:MAG: maleylpyruvate isomerase family mycothiol-dependent enzyme [Acidimicrobiales bacterium]